MSQYNIDSYGNKIWLNDNDQYHREDGPAVEYACGDKAWYINGKLHREDGPAIESFIDVLWFYKGKEIDCKSQEEFLQLIKLIAFW